MTALRSIERLGNQTNADLTQGITRASLRMAAHGRPIAITLWHKSDIGSRIQSIMHDLAERIEVGVLSITRVNLPFDDEVFVETPNELAANLTMSKLVIKVESRQLESGIVLAGRDGCELVIVAGVYPYSLAVLGLGAAPHRFEPEYSLKFYERREVM